MLLTLTLYLYAYYVITHPIPDPFAYLIRS